MLPAALTGYLWLKGGQPHLPGWSCPLRALTGIPCPTCFLTRATELALRGDLQAAVRWHAFGPVAAAALVLWSVAAIRQRRLLPQAGHRWLIPRPIAFATAGLLGYWLTRLGLQAFPGSDGVTALAFTNTLAH